MARHLKGDCPSCGHPRERHSAGGMCAGAAPDGSECYCVRFPDSTEPVALGGLESCDDHEYYRAYCSKCRQWAGDVPGEDGDHHG